MAILAARLRHSVAFFLLSGCLAQGCAGEGSAPAGHGKSGSEQQDTRDGSIARDDAGAFDSDSTQYSNYSIQSVTVTKE